MAQEQDTTVIEPSSTVVDTILHGNNNFVSTLDHLPCDLIRCLWVIQMMNLRNIRLQNKLTILLQNDISNNNTKEIERLNNLILRNAAEAEYESKYAVSILNNHSNILLDDLNILALLKSKLPGWTSDAVEKRWKEWGDFKINFIENIKNIKHNNNNSNNNFDNYFIKNEVKFSKIDSENKENIRKHSLINDISRNNHPNNESSNGNILKIKLNLKNSNSNSNSNIGNHHHLIPAKRKIKPAKIQNKEKHNNNNNLNINININNNKKSKSNLNIKIQRLVDKSSPMVGKMLITPTPTPAIDIAQNSEINEHYCFCGGPSFGKMVACENDKCPHEWFHFKCVGLTKEPEGNWFCSKTCEDEYSQKQKKKKKRRHW